MTVGKHVNISYDKFERCPPKNTYEVMKHVYDRTGI